MVAAADSRLPNRHFDGATGRGAPGLGSEPGPVVQTFLATFLRTLLNSSPPKRYKPNNAPEGLLVCF